MITLITNLKYNFDKKLIECINNPKTLEYDVNKLGYNVIILGYKNNLEFCDRKKARMP